MALLAFLTSFPLLGVAAIPFTLFDETLQKGIACEAASIVIGGDGKVTVDNPSCFSSIRQQYSDTAPLRLTSAERGDKSCGLTRIVQQNGQLTVTAKDCLNSVLMDSDNDGVPDAYDTLWGKGEQLCGAPQSMVFDKTRDTATRCEASELILARNVALNAADHVYSAPRIQLTPNFRVAKGAFFRAISVAPPTSSKPATPDLAQRAAAPVSVQTASPLPQAPVRLRLDRFPAALVALLREAGAQVAEGHADAAGQRIVFATDAALLGNDRNGLGDVYLFDIATGQLRLLSVGLSGQAANGPSDQPRIDGGGQYVVFASAADDLIAADQNGVADIYLYELASGRIEPVGLDARSAPRGDAANPVIATSRPEILYDRGPEGQWRHIYRADYQWPNLEPQVLSYDLDEQDRPLDNHHPAVSADGRFVAYREDSAACGIRVNDYQQQATSLLACPESPEEGFGGLAFTDDASALQWWPLPSGQTKERVAPRILANPLAK